MARVPWRLSTAQDFDKRNVFTSIATHIPWRKDEPSSGSSLPSASSRLFLSWVIDNNTVKYTPNVPSDTLWLPAGESLLSHFQTMKRNERYVACPSGLGTFH